MTKGRFSLDAYKTLQGINCKDEAYELKPSEQFLLAWGRKESSITHFDMNPYFHTWCKRFYPNLHDIKKLKSKFSYQATKLVKLGHLKSPNRIGLGPGSKAELFGCSVQTIWELQEQP